MYTLHVDPCQTEVELPSMVAYMALTGAQCVHHGGVHHEGVQLQHQQQFWGPD